MDEILYNTLNKYFDTLSVTGYIKDPTVFKILVLQYIQEITTNEFRYFITNKDIKLMQDLLYQLFGSTCEISFPTNNRCCCTNIIGEVPVYDEPQIDNFVIHIPEGTVGEFKISNATFDIINRKNVKADTLKIVYLNEGITVAEGLPIDSPVLIFNHTIDIKPGVSYIWKASVMDTQGNEIKSHIYTYTSALPSIDDFDIIPDTAKYIGSQKVTITGANFVISNSNNAKINSLKIYWNTDILADNLSTLSNAVVFETPVVKDLAAGNNYNIRASITDINGVEHFSKVKIITCEKVPIIPPVLSEFKLTPAETRYESTQDVLFTGATFGLSKGNSFKENSLEIVWNDTEVMNTGLSTAGSAVSFLIPINKTLTLGNTYKARASVEDTEGNKYYSPYFNIEVKAPILMYAGFVRSEVSDYTSEVIKNLQFKADYVTSKEFIIPANSNETGGFATDSLLIAIPHNVTLVSVQNLQSGYWEFGGPENLNSFTEQTVNIDGIDYTLYTRNGGGGYTYSNRRVITN